MVPQKKKMEECEAMIVLITGGDGQLGKELARKLGIHHKVYSLGRSELDITKKEKVENVVTSLKPDVIIHTAAFTSVDQCETEIRKAMTVNGIGTSYIALAAKKVNAKLIYISTDYVFDGLSRVEYSEEQRPNPQTIYGLSKWMGEQFTLTICKGTVIRTSWLYGHDGKNFVKTMIGLANQKKEIQVVNDQIGSPTYVPDLADTIIQLIYKNNEIYHISNSGFCSWYDFAKAILIEKGFNQELIKPVSTYEYGALAPRPKYSVLDHRNLIKEGILPLRHWREALKEYIREENFR